MSNVYLGVCVCVYIHAYIQCQTAGVPLPASQNRSIFNHVRESRLEMASWQRYTRSSHIYSWKAIFSQQTGSFALLVVWFIVLPRLKVYIYGDRSERNTHHWAAQSSSVVSVVDECILLHTHTHMHQCCVPHPSWVSVMYGLPPVWQPHGFNSALISSFDWSHTLKVRETGPRMCISLRVWSPPHHGDRCYDVDQVEHINLMPVEPSCINSANQNLSDPDTVPVFYRPHKMSCDAKRSQLRRHTHTNHMHKQEILTSLQSPCKREEIHKHTFLLHCTNI